MNSMLTLKRITLVLSMLLLLTGTGAATEPVSTEILYLSSSSVYVGKGSADGLTEETVLTVHRDGRELGRLQVSYLAEHSASCKIVLAGNALALGDEVRFLPTAPLFVDPDLGKPEPIKPWEGKPLELAEREAVSELSGRAALEWKLFKDGGDTGEDFQQPALSLRLNAKRIWNRPLDFRLRLRSKYSERSRVIDADRPETEWLHRLYEAALVWNDETRPYTLSLGRLYTRDLSAAGNWDGLQIDWRLDERWRVGVLYGGDPGRTDSEPDFANTKLGAYLAFEQGQVGRRGLRASLGAVGSYADGEVSRELLALRGTLWRDKLSLVGGAELDLNRDWREEAAGESSTLSRLNTLLRYRASETLSLNLAYDRYASVRDALNQEIPDSLWTDLRQSGLRAGIDYRLFGFMRLGGSVGFRDRDDRPDGVHLPIYANGYLGMSDLANSGVSLRLAYAFADSRYTRSHVPSLDLSRSFGMKLNLGLGLGLQSYEGTAAESALGTLSGQWLRLRGGYRINRHLRLQGYYGFDSGDILEGSQVMAKLAYRF
jgi:hypothetical protein